jgi:hypothetical protein
MKYNTSLKRRAFLRGSGLVVTLPWLECMQSTADAVGQVSTDPIRTAFVFVPNGVMQPAWKPEQAGIDYELTETLQPLTHLKSDFNVLTGLAQQNGADQGDGGGDHARSAATFLTGAHPYKTSGANLRAGVSVDQVAANRLRGTTLLPSLELGIEEGRNAGNCDAGYSCVYSNTISWKSSTTPLPKETNPREVFERLFGESNADPKLRERRNFFRQSILDSVSADARRLKEMLGQTDRRKMDEYLTGVRELEQRIERSAGISRQKPPGLDVPDARPEDFTQHVRAMYDLLALAFKTDSTRVATFMLGNEGSQRAFKMVDVHEGHHTLSHHGDKPENTSQLRKVDRYLVSEFGYFLDQLANIQEGERSLLDNSMIVYGSGLGDGDSHQHNDLPILMAGQGGGSIQTGRHLVYPADTPLNNLYLSMLGRLGIQDVNELGDSSGQLDQLGG